MWEVGALVLAAPDSLGGRAVLCFHEDSRSVLQAVLGAGVNGFLFLAFQKNFDSCLPVVRLEYVIPL